MSVANLSDSVQDYLKAVWVLGEWSDEPVTASMVAARVGVRLSTASDAMKKLSGQGLVKHARYGTISLTSEGREHAVAMVRRHRLIETFLVETLGYGWDEVHDEAEVLEHAVSDLMVERIDALLGHPDRDPHGDPIPGADGSMVALDARALTGLEPGVRARVERVSDADPALLQFLAEKGVRYASVVVPHPPAPFSDTVEVEVEGVEGTTPLGRSATDAVWVTPLSAS